MQVKIGWPGMTYLQSQCRWVLVFSATKAALNPHSAAYLLDQDAHAYLWLMAICFPHEEVAYQTCARTTTFRSLLEMCFYTYLILGIGWGDSWCIAKHASGILSENIFSGFWMRLLSWIMGSLIVTTPLHCNSCFWHQGNDSISTTWKNNPLHLIPYWFVKLTRF